jgi:acetyl esterase/lipase
MNRVIELPQLLLRILRSGLGLALVLLGVPACRVPAGFAAEPAAPPAARTCEVRELHDLAYYRGKDADWVRHRLDLFVPKGQKDFPVVMLAHGGAWMIGDKSCVGLYSDVGRFLARQGIGAALINYRLAPWVQHPEQIKDVARAFAWLYEHVADYGGDPDRLFVAGHSAGGHLVSLLATDETYLKAHGLSSRDIKGVIALSGVYHIPPGNLYVTVGGSTGRAFKLEQVMPVLQFPGWMKARMPALAGLPVGVDLYGLVFGDDPAVRADASPLNHVRPGLPPFLLFNAEKDLPTLPAMGEDFCDALKKEQCDARRLVIKGRNHNSIMFEATRPEDPVAGEMLTFIRDHAR